MQPLVVLRCRHNSQLASFSMAKLRPCAARPRFGTQSAACAARPRNPGAERKGIRGPAQDSARSALPSCLKAVTSRCAALRCAGSRTRFRCAAPFRERAAERHFGAVRRSPASLHPTPSSRPERSGEPGSQLHQDRITLPSSFETPCEAACFPGDEGVGNAPLPHPSPCFLSDPPPSSRPQRSGEPGSSAHPVRREIPGHSPG